ncbi:hypothetical protein [Burkholderia sp. LMU1-1-1.1]|uniref:hypothetical protein n=1 Tax=Burkholderia sp. LMU1-1-1.1 TaxID=3135266 RepID=UPI0034263E0A
MNISNIASVPAVTAGFPVTKHAEAACDKKYPVQLKEWLERRAFTMSMQAFGMCVAPVRSGRLHALKDHVADVATQLIAEDDSAIDTLRSAPLEFKREVLRYMQIIPAAIAAAFLGVSEKNLTNWQQCWSIFGKSYAGAHCYSLKELHMIAENRGQIYTGLVSDDIRAVASVADTALDEVVMVEEEVAAAFVDMSRIEIHAELPRNALMRRPYRLADLEKIRVAKLNASA